MNKKSNPKDRLVMVQTAVPRALRDFIAKLAAQDGRTVSQAARRLLESAPLVRTAFKKGK